jgi:hypothetical protein
MSIQEGFQSIIDDLTGPSNPKTKKTIKITRHLNCIQEFKIEVELPEGPSDLINDILNQIDQEGIDWGKPSKEETISCDDNFEVE